MNLFVVTGNPKKFEKILSVLHDGISPEQIAMDIPEIQSLLVDEVSADKAQKAFEKLQKPVIVEDTGIYFDAFQDYPGPLAKQTFQGLGIPGIKALFDSVKNKKIRFRSVVSYMDEHLDSPVCFVGESIGEADFSHADAAFDAHLPYLSFFRPEGVVDKVASQLDDSFRVDTHHRVKSIRAFNQRFIKSF